MNRAITVLISVLISLLILIAYDRLIIASEQLVDVTTIDVERIISHLDEQLLQQAITYDIYADRFQYLEQVIIDYKKPIFIKSIKMDELNRPLVFNTEDITDEILSNMEQIQ